jgi:hypothetical protein
MLTVRGKILQNPDSKSHVPKRERLLYRETERRLQTCSSFLCLFLFWLVGFQKWIGGQHLAAGGEECEAEGRSNGAAGQWKGQPEQTVLNERGSMQMIHLCWLTRVEWGPGLLGQLGDGSATAPCRVYCYRDGGAGLRASESGERPAPARVKMHKPPPLSCPVAITFVIA